MRPIRTLIVHSYCSRRDHVSVAVEIWVLGFFVTLPHRTDIMTSETTVPANGQDVFKINRIILVLAIAIFVLNLLREWYPQKS
jgi:hypothetical protein